MWTDGETQPFFNDDESNFSWHLLAIPATQCRFPVTFLRRVTQTRLFGKRGAAAGGWNDESSFIAVQRHGNVNRRLSLGRGFSSWD